jgi:hypothetical protein
VTGGLQDAQLRLTEDGHLVGQAVGLTGRTGRCPTAIVDLESGSVSCQPGLCAVF